MADDSVHANVPSNGHKRAPKPTAKAAEEKMNRLKNERQGKLAQLTRKTNEIDRLMQDREDVKTVEKELNVFCQILCQFEELNAEMLLVLSDEDGKDQINWFQPKIEHFQQFTINVKKWISTTNKGNESDEHEPQDEDDDGVKPSDSVSEVMAPHHRRKSGSVISSSVASSTSSARVKAEAKRAALVARVSALKKRQELEAEELRLKAKREQLELETEIAASNAELKVLKEYEDGQDGMNDYYRSQTGSQAGDSLKGRKERQVQSVSNLYIKSEPMSSTQKYSSIQRPSQQTTDHDNTQQSTDDRYLFKVMQRQNEITELLVKQQSLSQLPQRDVPIFSGDPLAYISFIRAFEHAIENKTNNPQDRLYYLEQFTIGEPQALVRSCEHMSPAKGYKEAKRLLLHHYGNELKIATAYLEKALQWPQIKAEDSKGMKTYALFLIGCRNTMADVEFMNEMNNPTNMRTVISKLPFRFRERWRNTAFDIQQRNGRRATFEDLVNFIDLNAQVLNDPLFGDIQDVKVDRKGKSSLPEGKNSKKTAFKGSIFATNVSPAGKDKAECSLQRKENTDKSDSAVQRACLFCSKEHKLDSCVKLKEQEYKDRIQFLKSKGLCFGCLTQGHMSKNCKKRITCPDCSLKHPGVLHIVKKEDTQDQKSENHDLAVSNALLSLGQETCGYTGAGDGECILSIIPVRVKSKKSEKSVETYAFLDPGSTTTFCTEDLMHQLNIQGKKTDFLLCTMGQHRKVHGYLLPDLEVCGVEENIYIDLPNVLTQRHLPVKEENIPKYEDIEKWPYLREVHLPHIEAAVGLLIGVNAHKAMEPWKVINSRNNGPYAVKTVLGWIVNGPKEESIKTGKPGIQSYTVNRISVEKIEDLLVKQFNLDFPERRYDDTPEMSQEDKQFMMSVTKSTKLLDGHYCMRLPLKDDKIKMPNNRDVAEQRLKSLQKRLKKNLEFHEDYTRFMNNIIDKGYAEKVPVENLHRGDGKVWYIPHHGVYHQKKKKIRVVFDCNASYRGFSLNGQLLQGPNLTNTLIGVLSRFREEPIAMMADIESMFYQVRVPIEDADFLRFLWWPDGNLDQEEQEYRMRVHLFGATSSPSCSCYALQRTAEDGINDTTPEAAQTLLKNFYVDDCLKSVATEEKAVILARDIRVLCNRGGFHLTKWSSNSRTVLSSIPEEERATDVKDLDLDSGLLPMERALGILWCTENDTFNFRIEVQNKPLTRRGILSVVGSVYDPLGFLAPFVLSAKLILRDLCKEKMAWDEEIMEKTAERWLSWQEDLHKLANFHVSRCIKPAGFGHVKTFQLHHFADASENGYGTVTYLLLTNEHDQRTCTFMMGKSRVAPLKQVTIPRMELTAATIAVKMDRMLRQELQIDLEESNFWTDSTTVLRYIENDSTRFKTFVANRVSLIREASKPSQWRYVSSADNPADQASRGSNADNLIGSKNWIKGPSFLLKPQCDWPVRPEHSMPFADDDSHSEFKKASTVNAISTQNSKEGLERLVCYFSSWHRLKKAVVRLTHLREILMDLSCKRKKIQMRISQTERDPNKQNIVVQKEMDTYKGGFKEKIPTMEDMVNAELDLIRYSQKQKFQEEIKMLQQGKMHVKKDSCIYRLDPYLEDGVLRVGGRLSRSAMPEESKHPIILHKDLRICSLIIEHIHQDTGHSGRNHILAKLRQKYWLPQANSAVRRTIHACFVCRRLHAKTGVQKMADLPEDRLLPDKPPFTNTGVDYFGPFEVRRGRSVVKRYGVLFTCLTIRAIHLEVAPSLDTDSCVNAIRRFICRRGHVSVIRSDNGTNFTGADRELREALQNFNQATIQEKMLKREIQWIFNTPGASHHGGVWERQIRTVRKVLNSTLRQQVLDDDGLHTLLCEVESIINGRPITKMSDDPNDLEALTPNHLLLMRKQVSLPPGVFKKDDVYSRRRWKQIQYLADLFWHRWTLEYLPLLQERQRWSRLKRNFEIGDIVLVVDSNAPRNSWMIGRIIKTMPDSKGCVRSVCVQTKSSTLNRPISKLCLLQEAV